MNAYSSPSVLRRGRTTDEEALLRISSIIENVPYFFGKEYSTRLTNKCSCSSHSNCGTPGGSHSHSRGEGRTYEKPE